MTRYVLVEDERFAYEEMKRMMQMLRPDYQLVGWAESIEQAVLLLRQNKIDLMIVDIRLSDGLSFEILSNALLIYLSSSQRPTTNTPCRHSKSTALITY